MVRLAGIGTAPWCRIMFRMLLGGCGAISRSGVQIALRLPAIGTASRCIMPGMLLGGCGILIRGNAQVVFRLLGASPIAV
jgi:hypothetical protein